MITFSHCTQYPSNMATTAHPPTAVLSAADRVFNIPEMVEMILSFCHFDESEEFDIRQLFNLQQVNSTFKAIISGSKALRSIMWLEKPFSTDPRPIRINPVFYPTLWPSCLDLFQCFKIRTMGCIPRPGPDGSDRSCVLIECRNE